MKQPYLVAVGVLVAAAAFGAACGGGGKSSDDKTRTAEATSAISPSRTAGTPSPRASGTAAAGTGTPQPGSTRPAGGATVASGDATLTAGDGTSIAGDNSTPEIVSTVPPPPPGTTPQVDSTEIAPPDPQVSGLQLLVDLDASQAGIQTARDVKVGDIFRVAIVAVDLPAPAGGAGGIGAIDFMVNYDKTRLVAPTFAGGQSIDRNPDLNAEALGGDAAAWSCLPEPEGDTDDPGGLDGDGDPATGIAFLSCFTPTTSPVYGTIVIATIEFSAVATGSTTLEIHLLHLTDQLYDQYGTCDYDNVAAANPIPCGTGTVTVK